MNQDRIIFDDFHMVKFEIKETFGFAESLKKKKISSAELKNTPLSDPLP